jgi:hypothetical protein
MNKKAQILGFIIVILISAIAVVGIFVGTFQTWQSLSCRLGTPLASSFEPHMGNLKNKAIKLDVTKTETTYDELYTICISNNTPDFCNINVGQECPLNNFHPDCSSWDLSVVYNGNPDNEARTLTFSFQSKQDLGEYDSTSYNADRFNITTMIADGGNASQFIIKPILHFGDAVGPSWMSYACGNETENGTYVKIEASVTEATAAFEEKYAFCITPAINATSNFSYVGASRRVEAITDVRTDCYYGQVDSQTNVNTARLISINNKMDSPDRIVHYITFTKSLSLPYVYIACKDMAYGIVGETWVTLP